MRWWYAIKPASWPKLLVPMLLGQCLGIAYGSGPSVVGAAAGLGFTLLGGIYIVLLNDWADRDLDAVKRRMFPQSSPKTIPDGVLSEHVVLVASLTAALGALSFMLWAQLTLARPGLFVLAVLGVLMLGAYSLPPLRLNYRGGGEAVEMLGVGLVLPGLNIYLQDAQPDWARLGPLVGFSLAALASALASGLADEESDRLGGKCTFTTQYGNAATRASVHALLVLAALWLALWALAGAQRLLSPLLAALCLLLTLRRTYAASPRAVTGAFASQRSYKRHLHRGIAAGGVILGLGALIERSWT